MIPELPEKKTVVNATKAGPPPVEKAPPASLIDAYEQDVLDLVTDRLDAGASEDEIVDELRRHEFGREESRRLIRALATNRPSAPTRPQARRSQPRISEEEQIEQLIAAEIDAGNRQMAFGAMWFIGGLLLTIVTFAARAGAGGILFWGAIIWGVIDFFRGANRVAAAKNLRNEL